MKHPEYWFSHAVIPYKTVDLRRKFKFFSEWFLKLYRESFLIIIRQKYFIIPKNKKGSAEQVSTPKKNTDHLFHFQRNK
jgi:hypothetical protein